MFGGTAKTYISWKWLSEPFKEDGKLYIIVEHPKTGRAKTVRFYEDKAHNDLKPKGENTLFKVFGFENKDSEILLILDGKLTEEQREEYFYSNWKRGGNWKITRLFGNSWYAPKDESVPPEIKKFVQHISWKDFVAEARKDAPPTSCWYEEGVL